MCFYSRLVNNPKYKPNKKNGGNPPIMKDARVSKVPIGCQDCMECRNAKAREWRLRLGEDIKEHRNGKFITLTFSNQSIQKLYKELKEDSHYKKSQVELGSYELDNLIATRAIRLFLERWRRKFTKSVRHWLVTELGHNGTENIHLHGIIWTNEPFETISERWGYGYVYPNEETTRKKNFVNLKTVNYIVKYVSKMDKQHPSYKSTILSSAGIGKNITQNSDFIKRKFKGKNTIETWRTDTGHKMAMPIYWRNKIYSEEEREKLWLQKLDKQERWVGGERIDISKGDEDYYKLLEWYRLKNKQLGYGNGYSDWNRKQYEKERRLLMHQERIQTKENPQRKLLSLGETRIENIDNTLYEITEDGEIISETYLG